jgi:6-phosphofructokinase 1
LIYLPERAFDQTRFLSDVKKVMDKHGRCVVAVSEGVADEKHVAVATKLMSHVEKDAHGNVELAGGALADSLTRLIKDKLGYKRVRGDTFGYVQRSFLGCVSDVDQREAREVGEKAVQFAVWGDRDGSVTIHRTGDYAVDYKLSGFEEIAGKTKVMRGDFIAADGNHVTDAFRAYLRPLLGADLPQAWRLRRTTVAKILKP